MANQIDLQNTVVLDGTLKNYTKERTSHDFVLNQGTRNQAGLTAVAAAMAGSGGAIGLAGLAGTQEIADKVSFEVEGMKAQGWLAWSPFEEGDEIEVVADQIGEDSYEVFAILRPADRMIALYPHCSMGRYAHYRRAFRLYCNSFAVLYLAGAIMLLAINFFGENSLPLRDFIDYFIFTAIGGFAFFGVIAFNVSRKYMPFVRMSEAIFTKLGWNDVKNIDLRKRSKKQRRSSDGPGLGALYFRY